jgi:hypothetical protein
MQGEEDLGRIYNATRYTLYSRELKEAMDKERAEKDGSGNTGENVLHTGLKKVRAEKKEKDPDFHVSDSAVMLALIGDPEIFKDLAKKYDEKLILFVTQFELSTSNKNTIEWMKQEYTRSYSVHYNLFSRSGNLLWAEVITVRGGNDNFVQDISNRYLSRIAEKVSDLLVSEFR